MNKLYTDTLAKWTMRILRQIHTAHPVGMGRKSRQYTLFQYIVQAQLSAHTDWISCMYLGQYPRLPFLGPHLPSCMIYPVQGEKHSLHVSIIFGPFLIKLYPIMYDVKKNIFSIVLCAAKI